MRTGNDMPWWSNKIVVLFALIFPLYFPAFEHGIVYSLLLFLCVASLASGLSCLYAIKPTGRVFLLIGIAILYICVGAKNMSSSVAVPSSFYEIYAALLIAFLVTLHAGYYLDRNKAEWQIKEHSLPDHLVYCEIIPLRFCELFLKRSESVEIPIKRTRKDTKYIALSDFDSWLTKSKTIKEGRREVIIERLKEFCSREGIQVLVSDTE